MATKKQTTKKSATKKANPNQTAAKRRTAAKDETQRAAPARDDVSVLGNADVETQKAAAVAASVQAGDPQLQWAVDPRASAVQQALADRDRLLQEGETRRRQAERARQETTQRIMRDLQPEPRAPLDNPTRRPDDPQQVGVSPDVTSPTSLMHHDEPRLPGTGVADPRDLAPGQSMAPSPPISSSNIVPTPLKPGTHFSKI